MDTIDRGAIRADAQKHATVPSETSSRDSHASRKNSTDVEKGNEDGSVPPAASDIPPLKGLSFLDRFLVVWILIAMGVGIAIGNTVPNAGPALQKSTFVGVSVPIAVGLLVMMYPILCKVRFETVSALDRPAGGYVRS